MFVGVRDIPESYGFSGLFEMLDDLNVKSFELKINKKLRFPKEVEASFKRKFGIKEVYNLSMLRKCLEREDYVISAILAENDFMPGILEEEVRYVLSCCKMAKELGVDVVRINGPMHEIKGFKIEDYVRTTSLALNIIKSEYKIMLAIENHGVIGNRPEFLKKLFQHYNVEFLGLTLDTGNFYWYGHPLSKVYEIIEMFADRVKHTHIKNAKVPVDAREKTRKPGEVEMTPLYEGDIDLGKVISILDKAGYDKDLTIEDESMGKFKAEERRTIIKKDVEHLLQFI